MRDVKSFLANLSQHPGVYQMFGKDGDILYVGKAKNLKKRVSSYFSSQVKDPKTTSLVKQIHHIEVTVTHSENEAVLLECNLIKKHRPRYNVLLRDDKSYPYIIITNQHPYPRIDLYRGQRKKNALYFGPYPSSLAVRETISLLQKVFKIRTCRDSYFDARTRPCLLHQIGRCTAPCVGLINKEDYAESVKLAVLFLEGKSNEVVGVLQERMEKASTAMQYEKASEFRDQIARLRQIQEKQWVSVGEGHADIIGFAKQAGMACIQLLTIREGQILGSRSYFPNIPADASQDEIISAFIGQHYLDPMMSAEQIPSLLIVGAALTDAAVLASVLATQAKHKVEIHVPARGDKAKWLAMAVLNATQALTAKLFSQSNMEERLKALQQVLGLTKRPRRVECFDVSHTMGEAPVASCVVFNEQGAMKSDYRRFNITDITPGDDVAGMNQVITRRFKRLQSADAPTPDVVLIDGGKTQLAAAHAALLALGMDQILLVGVSKGAGRKPGYETIHRLDQPPMHLPADSLALHFIQQIRDEAHRFAIVGHRGRRDKQRHQSLLEQIPGVGAKRRRELLRYFGGIQGVAHASLDELLKVPGINQSLAERIFECLHDATI